VILRQGFSRLGIKITVKKVTTSWFFSK